MKDWFKYEFGFVNIDSENIYLTNTGNWSEIEDLTEKDSVSRQNDRFKKRKILVFLIGAGIIFIFFFLGNIISSRISLLIILGLPLSGILIYNYLKTEIGSKFLIPLSKFKGIKIEGNQITLHFDNGEGKEDLEILKNVELKGIQIMSDLSEKWKVSVTESI